MISGTWNKNRMGDMEILVEKTQETVIVEPGIVR
jgi:hypothetical protein